MFNDKQIEIGDLGIATISPSSYRNKKDFVRAAMTRTIDRMLERGRISAETAMTLRQGKMFNDKQIESGDLGIATISPSSYRNKKDFVRAAMTRTIDRMLEQGRISAETAMTLRRGGVGRIAELLVDQKVSPTKK